MENYRPKRPVRPGLGGLHAAPQGVSTRDPRDEYHYGPHGNPDRDEARLAEFNVALQRAIDGVDWSVPF